MNYWLAQLLSAFAVGYGGQVLAARNSDEKDTGWMQILVFVILSVFYAVGSIVKARANKTAPKGKEQIPRKLASRRSRGPARKPPDLQILKQFFGLLEEAESSSQPSPEVAKPLGRTKRPAVARQVVMPSAFGETSPLGGQVQPKLGKVTAGVAAPAEIPRAKYLSEILSDYDDTEKLRRAILHYEILGKPLSLREPGEHIIGL